MKRKIIGYLLGVLFVAPLVTHAQSFSQLQQQLILLIQQVTQLQAQLNSLQRISNLPCYTLEKNIRFGDTGEDVEFLHVALEREGFSLGTEKAEKKFGELTASAVTGFQQKYKAEVLTPVGLSYGTGFVGQSTRAKLNALYGCGAKAPKLSERQLIRSQKHLTVLSPEGGQTVTSPLRITGYINSDGWISGNNAGTVRLVATLGRVLGQTSLVIKSDPNRMPIAFEGNISFPTPFVNTGALVFTSQNTSTFLNQAEKEIRVPIKFISDRENIVVRSPRAGDQLIAGETYTFEWVSTSSRPMNLYLIEKNLEALGSPEAFVWGAYNVPNTGVYQVALPGNISGSYRLFITDEINTGTSKTFYIYGRAQIASQPPVITEVSGPTNLKINEKGTWTVRAQDPDDESLTFSVLWGDGGKSPASISSQTDNGDWQAVFENHSYPLKYDYQVTFTATDSRGLTAQKVITVKVSQ